MASFSEVSSDSLASIESEPGFEQPLKLVKNEEKRAKTIREPISRFFEERSD
jgi:hypothetical protein